METAIRLSRSQIPLTVLVPSQSRKLLTDVFHSALPLSLPGVTYGAQKFPVTIITLSQV